MATKQLFHSWGDFDVNWAMAEAAIGGHVRLCHDWGASAENWSMVRAAEGGHHADVPRVG